MGKERKWKKGKGREKYFCDLYIESSMALFFIIARVWSIYMADGQKRISDSIAGQEADVQCLIKKNIVIKSFILKWKVSLWYEDQTYNSLII